jgi:hypothetical protein
MRRHALDWITHCPERLERPPINPKRQFLAARLPPPPMRPVINLRRTQHFSAARYESVPDPHLHRTAVLRRRRRPVTQVRVVRPFHRGPRRGLFVPDEAISALPWRFGGPDRRAASMAFRSRGRNRRRVDAFLLLTARFETPNHTTRHAAAPARLDHTLPKAGGPTHSVADHEHGFTVK